MQYRGDLLRRVRFGIDQVGAPADAVGGDDVFLRVVEEDDLPGAVAQLLLQPAVDHRVRLVQTHLV